jgi:hypothetical protein
MVEKASGEKLLLRRLSQGSSEIPILDRLINDNSYQFGLLVPFI